MWRRREWLGPLHHTSSSITLPSFSSSRSSGGRMGASYQSATWGNCYGWVSSGRRNFLLREGLGRMPWACLTFLNEEWQQHVVATLTALQNIDFFLTSYHDKETTMVNEGWDILQWRSSLQSKWQQISANRAGHGQHGKQMNWLNAALSLCPSKDAQYLPGQCSFLYLDSSWPFAAYSA